MTVVFLTNASTSPWSRPGDWTDAGHTVNLVGCGGRGGTGTNNSTTARAGTGGGGGGHIQLNYSSGALASTTAFRVFVNNTSTSDQTTTSATCWLNSSFSNTRYIQSGGAGNAGGATAGGLGATSSTYSTGSPVGPTYTTSSGGSGNAGGASAAVLASGTGGGGAAGVGITGGVAGTCTTASFGGSGGGAGGGSGNASAASSANGTAGGGSGGAGGTSGTPAGGAGVSGGKGGGGGFFNTAVSVSTGGNGGVNSVWTQTSDSATAGGGGGGGGGGGCSVNAANHNSSGGNGANYGGGGGGSGALRGTIGTGAQTPGTGASGLIVITYTQPVISGTLATTEGNLYELLLHFDGADASTTITDSGGKNQTVTAHGAAQIDDGQPVFVGQALMLAADTDYLSVDTGSWAFGTGDFCVDFHVRLTSATEARMFFDGGAGGFQILYDGSTLQFKSAAGTITSAAGLAASTNYHIAVTRGSGSTRLFKDGVQQGSTLTDSTNYATSAGYPRVGGAGAVVLDAATVAWAAAVVAAGGTVSTPRKVLVDAVFKGLKTDGVFTKLDRLYLLAAENSQSALVDLISNVSASAVSSPTFITDIGYNCTGSSSVNLNYNNSSDAVNYSTNSAHCGVWALIPGTDGAPLVSDNPVSTLEMYVHYLDGTSYTRINDSGGGSLLIFSSAGWIVGDRNSSSNRNTYLNGSLLGSVSSTVDFVSGNATLLGGGSGSAVSFGGSLTATDHANLYARILTYMNSIGALLNIWVAAVVAAGGTVSSGRQIIVQALINGLIVDGLWQKLDAIWVLAAENSQSAIIDLKALMSGIPTNTPTFNTDRGYTFDGSSTYFNTNYYGARSNNFRLNSAHVSAWAATPNTFSLMGDYDGTQGEQISYTTSWHIFGPNGGSDVDTTVTTPSTGLATITRTASNARAMYVNGSSIYSDTAASTAISVSGSPIQVGVTGSTSGLNWGAGQIAAVTIGGGLTATDAANLNSRLTTYMASVGLLTANLAQYWANAVVAAGGTVSSGRQTLVQTLINGLVSDGVWAKLDRLFLFAGENSQSALIDLVHLASATAVGSPTFTTDRGYAVSGTQYINTGYGGFADGIYGLNAASYGDWIMTAGTGGATTIFMGALGSKNSFLALDGSSNYAVLLNDDSGTYLSSSTAGTSTGFVMGSRTSSTQLDLYRNGSNIASGSHLSGQPFQPPFFVGCRDNNGGPDAGNPHSSSAAFIGGGLTGTDASNLYSRLRTYMTAVGVP